MRKKVTNQNNAKAISNTFHRIKNWLKHHINIDRIFFIAVILSLLFLLLPVILKCSLFKLIATGFVSSLEHEAYKGEFLSAVGGLLGGFLAVISAIWIQKNSEEKQQDALVKKHATIAYNDFVYFYIENTEFFNAVKSFCEDELINCFKNNSKAQAQTIYPNYKYIDAYTTLCTQPHMISINPNWITDVAELTAVLSHENIQQLYSFYGLISQLANLTNGKAIQDMTLYHLMQINALSQQLFILDSEGKYIQCERCNELLDLLEPLTK